MMIVVLPATGGHRIRKPRSMKFIDENHEAARPQLSPSVKTAMRLSIRLISVSAQPQPTSQPSSIPSREPSSQPSNQPSSKPSSEPSSQPSSKPSSEPSLEPSSKPSSQPSSQPSNLPSSVPSSVPSRSPSSQPSSQPSESPSSQPSESPSSQPSSQPSESPSSQPSSQPSESPSSQPSESPSSQPSSEPSESPIPLNILQLNLAKLSSNPSRSCENLRTDCGWGIFNPWTCQCDCAVGICLDNNQQCYTRCDETIKSNPWGGCSPGWDCPWYPDDSLGYCRSEMALVEKYDLYRTSMACCEKHFPLSSSCNADSIASVLISRTLLAKHGLCLLPDIQEVLPDLQNKQNCVRGKIMIYGCLRMGSQIIICLTPPIVVPLRSDCPDSQSAVTPNIEDEAWLSNPYPFANYYFPDFDAGSCGYGKNYPAWMAQDGYARWYLFRGAECCSKYFPRPPTVLTKLPHRMATTGKAISPTSQMMPSCLQSTIIHFILIWRQILV
ncbi:LOW QUALITY PROTEIN: hypothetical protein HJC23_000007 [Cyclotella cryptica]|uniref:Circumsporozoite protein n=1 Tax=Cyclotella cryptica TaxID=29204 RepID=A0ABD3P7Y3_9STRA